MVFSDQANQTNNLKCNMQLLWGRRRKAHGTEPDALFIPDKSNMNFKKITKINEKNIFS